MVDKSLRDSFREIQHSSSRLNEITDEANNIIRTTEKFLTDKCKVGIPAFVTIYDGTGFMPSKFLEYRKVNSKYRIAVVDAVVGSDGSPVDEYVRPWSECSRDVKLEAIKKLPDLLIKITSNLNERISEAETAISNVSRVARESFDQGGIE